MGGILLQGFPQEQPLRRRPASSPRAARDRALALSAQLGVSVTTNNLEAARSADIILLGVKPIQVPALVAAIQPG